MFAQFDLKNYKFLKDLAAPAAPGAQNRYVLKGYYAQKLHSFVVLDMSLLAASVFYVFCLFNLVFSFP